MIQSIMYVVEIAGRAVSPPQTYLEAQTTADLLGDEGVAALNFELMEHYPVSVDLRDRMRHLAEIRNL